MQSQILVCLSLAAVASAQLVYYNNGAVAPLDPNVHEANLEHFKALAEAGGFPGYAYGGNPIAVSHPFYALGHHIGKREADADAYYGHGYGYAGYGGYGGYGYAGLGYGYGHGYGYGYGHSAGLPASVAGLTTYANGAVVPVEPLANQIARANHLHGKFGHHFGKRSAEPQFFYGGLHGYGYGYAGLPFAPLVAHPASGAIVPLESAAVVAARHAHLAEVDKQLHNGGVPVVPEAAERKKRSAQYFYGGLHGYGYGYAGLPFAPLVAHPASGAIVPLESAAIVEARHAHLAEVHKQLHNGGVPVVPAAAEE